MKTEKHGSLWLATGNGPMRPIVAEGFTREDASKNWMTVYAEQYAQQEEASRPSYGPDQDDVRTLV